MRVAYTPAGSPGSAPVDVKAVWAGEDVLQHGPALVDEGGATGIGVVSPSARARSPVSYESRTSSVYTGTFFFVWNGHFLRYNQK